MRDEDLKLRYVLRLGDNALILSQRLIELVTHGPELEEELANANFALDYLGQARMFYSYAGELEGRGRSEDELAFLRDGREFQNLLIVEQPNGHFGDMIVRQLLFDAYYRRQLDALAGCDDERLRDIAARAVKEVRYHLRHAGQWLLRLGDGTQESHSRVQQSLDSLWRYSGEMFRGDDVDNWMRDHCGGPDLEQIHGEWRSELDAMLAEATLAMPKDGWMATGGRLGVHGEHFGFLIAEMQHLQRSYPGSSW